MDPTSTPEPADPAAPIEESLAFLTVTQSLMAGHDPSLQYLGTTHDAGRALADLAARTRSTVWNLQRIQTFYALRDSRRLNEAARRRGVTMRLVVNPAALHTNPILSSFEPDVRVGPVTFPLLVIDSRQVVVSGRDGDTIWTSSEPAFAALAVRAYEAVWSASRRAVPEGEQPLLTPRMVDIAWLLSEGASDRVISREMDISERTVSTEVREMGRRLGTSNRAHTIARICGAPA